MSLPRLYPKKARSARLLGCKRPRDGLQSLPPFWEPCFFCKCRFYAFLLTEEKLLCGITPTLPPKGTTSGQVLLTRRNFQKKKITAWFYGLPLLFRKKSPRRTKRRSYAFRLKAKRLLCGVAAPLPPKGTAALIAKNGRSARFFAKRLPTTFVRLNALRRFLFRLHYQLFSVKRFSLCSKRKRSELLFERSEGF